MMVPAVLNAVSRTIFLVSVEKGPRLDIRGLKMGYFSWQCSPHASSEDNCRELAIVSRKGLSRHSWFVCRILTSVCRFHVLFRCPCSRRTGSAERSPNTRSRLVHRPGDEQRVHERLSNCSSRLPRIVHNLSHWP